MDHAGPLAQTGIGGLTLELWPRAPYAVRSPNAPGVIGFAYEAQEGEDAIASDRVRPFRRGANTLAWIPPGCAVFSASRAGGEYLAIRGFAAGAIGHPDAPGRAVNDAVCSAAVAAARALRRLLLSGRWDSDVVGEALDVLLAALLRRMAGGRDAAAGWLTPARLATAERLIADRMSERLSVTELAAALGLSVGFLTLAFRGALGTTPHRWLLERRLARARAQLAATAKPIAAIAGACGFADQAHLTRHMQATLGVTPGAYRRLRARFEKQ
jgi:AraC family transcriptional regulator